MGRRIPDSERRRREPAIRKVLKPNHARECEAVSRRRLPCQGAARGGEISLLAAAGLRTLSLLQIVEDDLAQAEGQVRDEMARRQNLAHRQPGDVAHGVFE